MNLAQQKPFWKSTAMLGEGMLFIQESDGERPKSPFLFRASKILAVRSASGGTQYHEGRDFLFRPESNALVLPEGSAIPFKTAKEMVSPRDPNSKIQQPHRDGKSAILWMEGHAYHDIQVEVDYEHEDSWNGFVPSFAGAALPKTLGKLKRKGAFTLAVLGDSISVGGNASGWAGVAPFSPPYAQIVADNVRLTFGCDLTFKNFSVGGKTSTWGVEIVGQVAAMNPDLVIIAFGMNDFTNSMPAAEFSGNIEKMMAAIRVANPDAEFILVSTMSPNPDWEWIDMKVFANGHDALAKLAGPGVAFADVTAVWDEAVKRKGYYSMTGNGVNHASDFGHRLYAMVVGSVVIEKFGE